MSKFSPFLQVAGAPFQEWLRFVCSSRSFAFKIEKDTRCCCCSFNSSCCIHWCCTSYCCRFDISVFISVAPVTVVPINVAVVNISVFTSCQVVVVVTVSLHCCYYCSVLLTCNIVYLGFSTAYLPEARVCTLPNFRLQTWCVHTCNGFYGTSLGSGKEQAIERSAIVSLYTAPTSSYVVSLYTAPTSSYVVLFLFRAQSGPLEMCYVAFSCVTCCWR